MPLAGKRIIVTGAATGIGRATALTVASRGARVAAFDVNDDAGSTVVDAIIAAGGAARYWHVDVSVEAEVEAAVADATDWLGGGPDVLLHLAGVLQGAWVDIAEFPEATWDRVLDINLKGSFLVSKHVAARMQQNGSGCDRADRVGRGRHRRQLVLRVRLEQGRRPRPRDGPPGSPRRSGRARQRRLSRATWCRRSSWK